MDKPDCGLCRKMHKLKNKEVKCDECAPRLKEENWIPMQIFMRVRGQLIFGPSGPVAVRQEAVWQWIDRMQVHEDDKDWCYDLVQAACGTYLEAVGERQAAERVKRRHGYTR